MSTTEPPYIWLKEAFKLKNDSPDQRELSNQNHQRIEEPALRYDKGKTRYDLIPTDALKALADVYGKGAEKYADRNWEQGLSYSRCYGSLLRHLFAWWAGEKCDPETGCHHLMMAAWNAFALFCYEVRGVGTDDRPSSQTS